MQSKLLEYFEKYARLIIEIQSTSYKDKLENLKLEMRKSRLERQKNYE